MKKLAGKVAVVTGSAEGNGLGAAKVMARHGARVILTDIKEEVFSSSKALKQQGLDVKAYQMDVTNFKQVKHIFDQIARNDGLDILVNNAGVCNLVGFLDMDDNIRDRMFSVNIGGTWNCTKAALPHMITKKYGKIVNISSVTGPVVVDFGHSAYAASKGAISAFTRAIALEFAKYNINVNAVLPGYFLTSMVKLGASETNPNNPQSVIEKIANTIPIGRFGTIDELGELVAFLSSDESSYMTGAQIVIDGGSTLPETAGAMGVS